MRIYFIIIFFIILLGCNAESSKGLQNQLAVNKYQTISIRQVDFRNFSYPLTKDFKDFGETYTLINGGFGEHEGRYFSLQSVMYEGAKTENEKAVVTIQIDDGNATQHILYIYEMINDDRKMKSENVAPKLLQTFVFNETNNSFASAFFAHGEFVIETYNVVYPDAQCCPSVIERQHYQWKDEKFILMETQKIPNNFVERMKRNKK